jgi:hypothetical protein
MEPARAARLYAALERLGRGLEMVEGNYVNPMVVHIGTPAENSYFDGPQCFPGVDILRTANVLAVVAKKPMLTVPSPAEIEAANLLAAAKARLSSRQNNQAEDILKDIVAHYGRTKAAEEARKLLTALSPPSKR